MRTRMSLRLAIGLDLSACRGAARHHRNRLRKCLRIRVDRSLELGSGGVVEVFAVADGVEEALVLGTHQHQQAILERAHPIDRDRVEVAVDAGINGDDLLFHLQRGELRLLEQLGQPRSAGEQALGGGIEVGTELREGRHFAVLRELALDAPGDLLHRLGLGGRADARHRQADVHRRADALVEQVGFQEDLAVGDRDDVGRNVGGHVVRLGLDHGQRREGAALVGVVHLRGALEQARVQIEYVAGIGFAAGRAAQQQRHLTIGDRLFGEIVVDDHGVHAVVAEIFPHGAAGKWRDILHWRGIGRGRRHYDRIIERAVLLQHLGELDDGGALLPDRDIDAVELHLLIASGVDRLLVQDGVERNRGLAGLAVADDQLALAAADWNQRIDRLEPGGHRLVHGFAWDNAGRLDVHALALGCLDRALAVDGIAERVHNTPEQAFADRHVHDGAGALDGLPFLDLAVLTEDHDADVVGLEIERHTAHAVLELDHLAGLHIVEAVDTGDTVTDREHLADLGDLRLLTEILDLLFQDGRNFGGTDVHQRASFIANLIALSLVRSELSTMREPSLTTRPPMIEGSTFTSIWTCFLVMAVSVSLMAARCASLGFSATVTSAVTSPLCLATSAR